MEKVMGIGGLFFRARDPKLLAHWYEQHLGVALTPGSYEDPPWFQEARHRLRTVSADDRLLRPGGASLDGQLPRP